MRAPDVGRQRHRTVARERAAKRVALQIEVQGDITLGVLCRDRRSKISGEVEAVADAQPPRTPGKGAPRPAALVAMEGDLDPCRSALADEPGRDDLGVIADEKVAGAQQIGQISDMPIGKSAAALRDVQQARRLARLARMIGDQLARQRKIEIVEAHCIHGVRNGPPVSLFNSPAGDN